MGKLPIILRSWPPVYLALVFFISGFSALTYQVCWSKILSQAVGLDAVSWMVSICIFLSGLAGGSLLAQKILPRLRQPQWLFFAIEIGLGIYGLVSEPLIRVVARWSGALAVDPFSTPAYWIDFCAQALVLSPATIGMGMALPLLVASFGERWKPAQASGILYAITTLGGAVGVLVMGVYGIGSLGIRGTLLATGCAQSALGLLSLVLLHGHFLPNAIERAASTSPVHIARSYYGAAFVLGALALMYEVLLLRVLTYYLSATSYVVCVGLSAYLFHLALGSWLGARRSDDEPRRATRWAIAALGSSALLFVAPTFYLLFSVPFHSLRLAPGSGDVVLLRSLLIALVLFLPVTFLSGLFPQLFSLATQGREDRRTLLGGFLFFQAAGNIAGILLTVLVWIPWIGTAGSFRIGTGLLVGFAWWVGRAAPARDRWAVVAMGVGMTVVARPAFLEMFTDPWRNPPLAVYEEREGSVFFYPSKCMPSRIARIGAEDMGDIPQADWGREVFPIDFAAALRLDTKPRRTLIIGLGRGDQAFALKHVYPDAEVDVVELFPSMIEEVRRNGSALARETLPKLNMYMADGRRFLERMRERRRGQYDIIQMGTMNLSVAGAGNLYTVEAMAALKDLLAPGGVLIFRAYPPAVQAALKHFPTVAVAVNGATRLAHAIATDRPIPSDVASRYKSTQTKFASVLAQTGFQTSPAAGSHYYSDRGELETRVGRADLQRDDLPTTEYFLSRLTTPEGSLPDKVIGAAKWKRSENARPIF